MSRGSHTRASEEIPLEERVQAYLLRDLSLADNLSRGLANLGRTARWLRSSNGWEEEPGEVVRALRGYVEKTPVAPWQHGQRLLTETRVTFEMSLALLTLSRTIDVRQRLEDAWIRLAELRRASIVDYRKRFRLIIDDHAVEEVREILPKGSILRENRSVWSIRLTLPEDPESTAVPGVVVAGFLSRGIEVLQVLTAGHGSRILIPRDHWRQAHRVARMMTDPPEDWPRGVGCRHLSRENEGGEGPESETP